MDMRKYSSSTFIGVEVRGAITCMRQGPGIALPIGLSACCSTRARLKGSWSTASPATMRSCAATMFATG